MSACMIVSANRIGYRMFNRAFSPFRSRERGEAAPAPQITAEGSWNMHEDLSTILLVLESPVLSPCAT